MKSKQKSLMQNWKRRIVARLLRVAIRCLFRGWVRPAEVILRGLIELAPQEVVVRIWLARVEFNLGDDEAVRNAIRPDLVDHLPNIRSHYRRVGDLYSRIEDYAAARRYLLLATEAFPNSAPAWHLLAITYVHSRDKDLDRAVECFRRQSSLELTIPRKVKALEFAADALANAGRRDAEDLYLQVLELQPQHAVACFGLAECRRISSPTDPLVEKIRELLAEPTFESEPRQHLHFALGGVYDRCGEPNTAFSHFSIANQIRTRVIGNFSIESMKAEADARCRVFTKELIERLSPYGCHEESIVFIVGMPRSGTSLVHQLLQECPNTCGLGERVDVWQLITRMPLLKVSKKKYPFCCSDLTENQIRKFSRQIRDRLRRFAKPGERIITKLPENYVELGLIKILFPNSRMIHCMRNPVDTCWSCYMQNFNTMPFANDLFTLAEIYRLYLQLMEHWRSVLPPSQMHEVAYELLVEDPQAIVPKLCDFAGLEYSDACLEFHRSGKYIATTSRWQVREPIYKSAVRRSSKYREFLGPLLALEALVSQPEDNFQPETDHRLSEAVTA